MGRVLSIRSALSSAVLHRSARSPMPNAPLCIGRPGPLRCTHVRGDAHESQLCSALRFIVTANRAQRTQTNAPKLPYEPQFLHKIFTLGLVQQACVEKRP